MVKCGDWPVGVCSWSLQTDIAGVADAMAKLGIEHVHLAVRPALQGDDNGYLAAAKRQNWTISSTMIDFPQEDYSTLESIKLTGGIAPDRYWQPNHSLVLRAVDVTTKLGVKRLSMHAGFIDAGRPEYARKFYDRIQCLADAAAKKNIILLMETGQETADELSAFLKQLDHPSVGVNFDPANMILYDKGSPVEAVRVLAPWIKHIHIKDAIRTKRTGTWGTETPWGQGEVDAHAFLEVLKEIGFDGVLAVEREAGEDRFGDIKLAVNSLSSFIL
ncbi:MAG: sugar phosphate isomerase/epimerase family protein [Planctomycetota bacterium]|jgi:sugar phosphate isomerase/epimerase